MARPTEPLHLVGIATGGEHVGTLSLARNSGAVVSAPLDRRQLTRVIQEAAAALDFLNRREELAS